ncbi:MAG: Rid family hydrolase [Pseudomonadota bacterium]
MTRTAINPWTWSLPLGYNQAERVEGATAQLFCAGQTAVDADGTPCHDGDMRAQLALALDNLEATLTAGGMGFADVVRLTVYSTDVDATLAGFDLLGARLGPLQARPPMSLIGVTRLAMPTLLVELEATALR